MSIEQKAGPRISLRIVFSYQVPLHFGQELGIWKRFFKKSVQYKLLKSGTLILQSEYIKIYMQLPQTLTRHWSSEIKMIAMKMQVDLSKWPFPGTYLISRPLRMSQWLAITRLWLWPSLQTTMSAEGRETLYMHAEVILCLPPANERCRYKVTPSLIGWAQT